MTTCEIRQEIYPQLTAHVAAIAEQVIPALESVTRLSFDAASSIRCIDRETFVHDVVAAQRRSLERDVYDVPRDRMDQVALDACLYMRERNLREGWMLASVTTLEAADGTIEVLLAQDVLHHAGVREKQLTAHLTQALCRALQYQAGPLMAVHNSAYPQERGLLEEAFPAFVVTGYATWATDEVTRQLFGRPVPVFEETGFETAVFHQALGLFRTQESSGDPVPGPGLVWLPALHGRWFVPPWLPQQGGQWAAGIVQDAGVELLNQVWAQPVLTPTLEETTDRASWIHRVRAHAKELAT
ncbi:hypothetical protein [Streptomyces aureocirculatus]|uniref:hypothetical protein n=1 Tax=Streptomyces aureocirculatus TaxID=67275 RepID=UPI0004C7EF75|nr:hypothetical protein [Streptomyces aureocirculatus]